MDSMLSQTGATAFPVPTSLTEELVSNHFENVFALFNTVFDDHIASINHTEQAFRATADSTNQNSNQLYNYAVEFLLKNGPEETTFAELNVQSTLCFLLKELENFRYQEIAEIMKIEREEVKQNIAQARNVLLKKVA